MSKIQELKPAPRHMAAFVVASSSSDFAGAQTRQQPATITGRRVFLRNSLKGNSMRFLRSLACVAIAMCASVMMTMPSVAAVPMDPGISVMAPSHAAYPAPTIATVDHAALTCEAPAGTFRVFTRSLQRADSLHLASSDGSRSSFLVLRRRC